MVIAPQKIVPGELDMLSSMALRSWIKRLEPPSEESIETIEMD
jgi:hypothetical protein